MLLVSRPPPRSTGSGWRRATRSCAARSTQRWRRWSPTAPGRRRSTPTSARPGSRSTRRPTRRSPSPARSPRCAYGGRPAAGPQLSSKEGAGLGELLAEYDVLGAFWMTIKLTVVSALGALLLGTVVAVMRVSPVGVLRAFGTAYVTLVRNTPLTLIVFFCAFGFYITLQYWIGAQD